MTPLDLYKKHKDGSTLENQSIQFTTSTKMKEKKKRIIISIVAEKQ